LQYKLIYKSLFCYIIKWSTTHPLGKTQKVLSNRCSLPVESLCLHKLSMFMSVVSTLA